jgi:hypothetical protein
MEKEIIELEKFLMMCKYYGLYSTFCQHLEKVIQYLKENNHGR